MEPCVPYDGSCTATVDPSRYTATSGQTESALLPAPDPSDFVEYQAATWLWIYVAPALLVIGACGNVLSLAVLRGCASFRKSSVGFTLSALAVVDTGVLCVPLLRQWLVYVTDNELDLRCVGGAAGCKLHFFLSYFLSQLSSWTVIVVTVERTMYVGLPIIAKIVCSRTRVVTVWSIIVVLLLILNSHFFVIAEYPIEVGTPMASTNDTAPSAVTLLRRQNGTGAQVDYISVYNKFNASHAADSWNDSDVFDNPQSLLEDPKGPRVPQAVHICYVAVPYRQFLNEVWYWMDFAVLSAVPFLIVAVGNCVIGVCVVRAVRFRLQHQRRDSPTAATGDNDARCLTSGSDVVSGAGSRDRKWKSNNKYSAAVSSSTLMLLGVSITFLLTTTPNVIYFLKVDAWIAETEANPDRTAAARSEARLRLLYAITCLLLYTNNSVNFLLYCITGSRFRRAARDLFARSGVARPSGATAVAGGVAAPLGPVGLSGGPRNSCSKAPMVGHRGRNGVGGKVTGRDCSSATGTN